MTRPAIKVEGLSKEYVLGGESTQQTTFREMLMGAAREPIRRLKRLRGSSKQQERFWALKNINFTVNQGEVVGVIGANGAGKSTLLKVLSRITAPTEGRIQYRGKIASLLEVGTGFHPELSGRENIFINGAILGMTRREIQNRFDEIVDFAGVEKFLDTPVKRYSSGMYVRLAFAVASHMDPDILVIDEVLAVGDADFQKRCIGKMKAVSEGGRTVLFVSHNLNSITNLCNKTCLLVNGSIDLFSKTSEVVSKYLGDISMNVRTQKNIQYNGSGEIIISNIIFRNKSFIKINNISSGDDVNIELECVAKQAFKNVCFAIGIYGVSGQQLSLLDSAVTDDFTDVKAGLNKILCNIPALQLAPGIYYINIAINYRNSLIYGAERCAEIHVEQGDYYRTGKFPRYGYFLMNYKWSSEELF